MQIPPGALVVLVGPQGCGKSTFARRWFRDTQIVSSDECRRLVSDDASDQEVSRDAFVVFYTLLRARLTHGRTTVADATNLTPWARLKLRQIAVARGRPLVAIAFDVPLETCLARQAGRERQVPPHVVQRSHEAFRQALADLPHEGYERLYVVQPEAETESEDDGISYRYGDFPELFADLDPTVKVDRDDPLIITRVLRDGNLSHAKKLVRMDVLARKFDLLELPSNVRDFWMLVLKKISERGSGTSSS
ncbi:MAG TPA: AAA family ATPase [Longimicrobium sp.]|nr:AAA family ATPase [Longimicrobium sp.]